MLGFDARRGLVRHGLILFLLGCLTGFAVPSLTTPRLGLSAHLVATSSGIFLIALGVAWRELRLAARTQTVAYGMVVVSSYLNWAACLIAGILGARSLAPIASGGHSAGPIAEAVVTTLFVATGLTTLVALAMLIFGMRGQAEPAPA
jgi:hydroxylaminobenzene mutase